MVTSRRLTTILLLLLILPAGLFMLALVVRFLPALQFPAQQVVLWYARRQWTLWLLLIALPLSALVSGLLTLLRMWNEVGELQQAVRHPFSAMRGRPAALLTAIVTLAAGAILLIVAGHMLMN